MFPRERVNKKRLPFVGFDRIERHLDVLKHCIYVTSIYTVYTNGLGDKA